MKLLTKTILTKQKQNQKFGKDPQKLAHTHTRAEQNTRAVLSMCVYVCVLVSPRSLEG